MSAKILTNSQDLLTVQNEPIDQVLIPKLQEYVRDQTTNTWLPPGADLSPESEVSLNLYFNVNNFCYKDPASSQEYSYVDRKGSVSKRSSGLFKALAEAGIDWNNPKQVEEQTVGKWEEIIQLTPDNPMYLGKERGERITKFAEYLQKIGCDASADLVKLAQSDSILLVGYLERSGLFTDKFLKRAQLASRMVGNVLVRRGEPALEGSAYLTVPADYRVPQVFYNFGVVKLAADLQNTLEHETPIAAQSREELALRATAVSVGSEVAQRLNITEAECDERIWGLSQVMAKKRELPIPHMIVATDAY